MDNTKLKKILGTEIVIDSYTKDKAEIPLVPMVEIIQLYTDYLKYSGQSWKLLEAYHAGKNARNIENELNVVKALYGRDASGSMMTNKTIEDLFVKKMLLSPKTFFYFDKHHKRKENCKHDVNFMNEAYMVLGLSRSNFLYLEKNICDYLFGKGNIKPLPNDVIKFSDVLPCIEILGPMLYHTTEVMLFNRVKLGNEMTYGTYAFLTDFDFYFNPNEIENPYDAFYYASENGDAVTPYTNEFVIQAMLDMYNEKAKEVYELLGGSLQDLTQEEFNKLDTPLLRDLRRHLSNITNKIKHDPFFTTKHSIEYWGEQIKMRHVENYYLGSRVINRTPTPNPEVLGFMPFSKYDYIGNFVVHYKGDGSDETELIPPIPDIVRDKMEDIVEILHKQYMTQDLDYDTMFSNYSPMVMLNHYIESKDNVLENIHGLFMRYANEFQMVTVVQKTPLDEYIGWHVMTRNDIPRIPKVN